MALDKASMTFFVSFFGFGSSNGSSIPESPVSISAGSVLGLKVSFRGVGFPDTEPRVELRPGVELGPEVEPT